MGDLTILKFLEALALAVVSTLGIIGLGLSYLWVMKKIFFDNWKDDDK